MTDIAKALAENFKKEFSDIHPLAGSAKPLNAIELRTAHDLERGHKDRTNNKPKLENQSEAYYLGYESTEITAWAN